MERPTVAALPQIARDAARAFAERLAGAGHRAWLVGGVVRDLARGEPPTDLDFASAARPEEVEALFERAIGVGRRFGTSVVPLAGVTIEHTTFRTEGAYTDGRRPDRLDFGTSLEDDAARRDFTCNALYLDPATDELADPTGGFADLAAGRLRAVGDPAARFREDGLRLLRLARFAAKLGFEPEPATLEGARASRGALAALSVERVLTEWERIAEGPAAERALDVLGRAGLLGGALPGLRELGVGDAELDERRRVVVELARGGPPGLGSLLAAFYDPGPPWAEADVDAALAALDRLKPSRALRRDVARHFGVLHAVLPVLGEPAWERRARHREVLLDPGHTKHVAFALAWRLVHAVPADDDFAALIELALTPGVGEAPPPLVTAADLTDMGLAPGPRFGRLLAEVRRRQLGGALADRDAALDFARDALRG